MRSAVLSASVFLTVALCVSADSTADAPAAGTPAPGTPAPGTPAGGIPAAAVWKEQRLEFLYTGRTSRYSCEGLRDKVRAMLLDLGVRRDLTVAAVGCLDFDRATESAARPRLRIVFSSPALPEAGAKPVRNADPAASRFERFTITNDAFRNMGMGDCELVEEFAQQILPKLTVRNVREDIACVPYEPSSSKFLIQGEVLKTLPPAKQDSLGGGQSADGA